MAKPRNRGVLIFILVFVGIAGIMELIGRPRFQAYHAVDVVQLVGAGMCFGVALVWIIGALRKKSDA